jgi:hypothetical protein
MYVVSIDPGIVSIGLVHVEVSAGYELLRVLSCEAVNMTRLRTASGGSHVHDMIAAFLLEYDAMLTGAEVILLERQPFQSAGMPLELLFRERFGCKCVFLSPHTIHKRFGLQGFEYDGRKERAVAVITHEMTFWSSQAIPGATEALATLGKLARKHDICDAMMIFIVWVKALHERTAATATATAFPECTDFKAFTEKFRYVPTKKKNALRKKGIEVEVSSRPCSHPLKSFSGS